MDSDRFIPKQLWVTAIENMEIGYAFYQYISAVASLITDALISLLHTEPELIDNKDNIVLRPKNNPCLKNHFDLCYSRYTTWNNE